MIVLVACDTAIAWLQDVLCSHMTDEKHDDNQSFIDKLVDVLLQLPWLRVLEEAWEILRRVVPRQPTGIYEVLEYESTLELKDPEGKNAIFNKRESVRYLQDNIIAYQDQAWGDGEILLDYRCSPGTPVDQYRTGHKTYILISRREVKNKGDVDEFNIQWSIQRSFLQRTGYWETHVTHQTRYLKVSVIFPKSRPPRLATLIESNRQRSHTLAKSTEVLPDGRWLVTWETYRPRL